MRERPDYVHCTLTGMFVPDTEQRVYETWCGRNTGGAEFSFLDASHAALNARKGGRALLCHECSRAIMAALDQGTWAPD